MAPLATALQQFWSGPAAAADTRRILETLAANLEGMLFRCAVDEGWGVEYASVGCFELTGYRPVELIGGRKASREQLIHPEDRAVVMGTILAALDCGSRYRIEYRIRCRDGTEKWVLERGAGVADEDGRRLIEGYVEDITDRVLAQIQLAETELRYRSIFENSVVGMFQTTEDGRYLAANRALAVLYRYESPEALIASLSDIATRLYVDPGRRDEFKRVIRARGRVTDFESEVVCRDGQRIWISENAHAVYGTDGAFLYYEGTVEDISERRLHEAQLEYQATHDPLTGLPNRNLLPDRLELAMGVARRHQGQVAVAFVDLDNFKVINDSLGHAAGDRLLMDIAQRLKECLRASDTVVRYGGDEFVLILGEQSDVGSVIQALERLQEAIRAPLLLEGHQLCMSCSIGVSLHPLDGRDMQTLLRHADAAMYHAKEQGKGQFQFYTAELNAAAKERLALESALRRAIDGEQLTVAYQPKVDRAGRTCGFEALVRWTSPEFGPVSPARFIPLAEEVGLMGRITDFVLRAACRAAATWASLGWPELHVAVNLSAREFADGNLVAQVGDVLAETGLPPESLQLEITEGVLVGDVEGTVATLSALKALGVRIAVDDFGTGYSSLAYLKRFPIDILKIDRSFVMGCDRDPDALAIPRAIISLGLSLGLTIVAEGVEKPGQFAILAENGCQEFQGYLISRPLPPEAVLGFLRRREAVS